MRAIRLENTNNSVICSADGVFGMKKLYEAFDQSYWIELLGDESQILRRYKYTDEKKRDADYAALTNAINTDIERSFMDSLKQYFKTHRDTIFTIIILVVVDHYLLGGAFRDRIKSLMENFLNKTEKKLLT